MVRTNRFFDSAGARIRYVEQGDGEPVVLVHSYAGDLDTQWVKSGVLDALAARYRVVALDVRGHGKSDKPHDPAAYGRETAWDLVRLLDHLRIARAHMIGYSMGAHIVAQLLTLAPARFITATLGGACGRLSWTAEDDAAAEKEAQEMERGLLSTQLLRLWPAGEPQPNAAEVKARSAEILAGKDRHALAAMRRANRLQVVTADQIADAGVPVIGIVGSADPYRARFETLRGRMPALQLVVLDGATHLSASAHPGFLSSILTFLDSHTPS